MKTFAKDWSFGAAYVSLNLAKISRHKQKLQNPRGAPPKNIKKTQKHTCEIMGARYFFLGLNKAFIIQIFVLVSTFGEFPFAFWDVLELQI